MSQPAPTNAGAEPDYCSGCGGPLVANPEGLRHCVLCGRPESQVQFAVKIGDANLWLSFEDLLKLFDSIRTLR